MGENKVRYVKMAKKGSDRVLETSPGITDHGAHFSKPDKLSGLEAVVIYIRDRGYNSFADNMIKTVG